MPSIRAVVCKYARLSLGVKHIAPERGGAVYSSSAEREGSKPVSGARGGPIRHYEELDETHRRPPRKNAAPKPPAPEEKTVEEELLQHLAPLIEDHLLLDVVRPIKSGKEAVVYCCRAHPSLERDLVAAKVYRPLEMRSFKRDTVYQQGRDRGARPDARVLRALGKKTQHGRSHKFSAWIAHEMRTLEMLHAAGCDVPCPLERVGPVILMDYLGDLETPAPVLVGVSLERDEASRLYERVLENVEMFLAKHRVHADLSPYNMLYWQGHVTIIDFPQAVDPRHNADALELLVRDLENVGRYFADAGAAVVDPQVHALALWRKHVDPQH